MVKHWVRVSVDVGGVYRLTLTLTLAPTLTLTLVRPVYGPMAADELYGCGGHACRDSCGVGSDRISGSYR